MNLEDFKKIDLKSVNIGTASAFFLGKKAVLAQGIVGVLSVLALIGIINHYREQKEESQQQITQLNTKIKVMQSYEDSQKKMKLFLANLPKELDEEQFSSQIADYAAQNNVSIVTFAPGQKNSDNFSDALSLHLVIQAAYKDFLRFIKDIEYAPYALRIDSCLVSAVSSGGTEMKINDVDQGLEAQMDITSIGIKK